MEVKYQGEIWPVQIWQYVSYFYRFLTQSRLKSTLKKKAFENIEEKGESSGNLHFHLFPQCFLPIREQIPKFDTCFNGPL